MSILDSHWHIRHSQWSFIEWTNELIKKKKGGNEGGRRKRAGVIYNMKPNKSLESSMSDLSISLDHGELVGHIQVTDKWVTL